MSSHQRKRRRSGPGSVTDDPSYRNGVDIRLLSPDNTEQAKRYIREILDNPRSITRIKFDGSITITPNPLILPNHIIASILFHVNKNNNRYYGKRKTDLFQCALVNRQFYMHANMLLWQDAMVRDGEQFVTCLENGRRYLGHLVRDLQLTGEGGWTDLLLLRLIQHVPYLDALSICHTPSITDTSFQYLPRFCPHLTTLTFKSCHFFSRPSFMALGQYCRLLRKLTLLQCLHVPADLFDMLRRCPLEDIHIVDYNFITTIREERDDDGNGHFMMNASSMESLKQFYRLTHLKIETPYPSTITSLLSTSPLLLPPPATVAAAASSPPLAHPPPPSPLPRGCDPSSSAATATAIVAAAAVAIRPNYHWPRLKELDLSPCHGIDDITLMGFLQYHPLLTTLELRSATLVTDASLTMMTRQWLPNLTRVRWRDAIHFSPQGVRHFLRHSSPFLVSAIFHRCDRLSTSDLAMEQQHNNNNRNSNRQGLCHWIEFDEASIVKIRRQRQQQQQGQGQKEADNDDEAAAVIVVEQQRRKIK